MRYKKCSITATNQLFIWSMIVALNIHCMVNKDYQYSVGSGHWTVFRFRKLRERDGNKNNVT